MKVKWSDARARGGRAHHGALRADGLGGGRGKWVVVALVAWAMAPFLLLLGVEGAALVLRLLGVMALYSVCRIVFYGYNQDLLPDVAALDWGRLMWGGWRFDLAAVLYTNALLIVFLLLPLSGRMRPAYRAATKWVFCCTNAVALATNCVDFIFYRFTLRRTTAAVFAEFSHDGQLWALVPRVVVQYWHVTLFWLVCVAALVWLNGAVDRVVLQWPRLALADAYPTRLVRLVAGLTLAVVGMRGGFFHRSHRPINNASAGQYVTVPEHTAVVLNTPFSLIRTIDKKAFVPARFFADEELGTIYDPRHPGFAKLPARRSNVVLIILENFGREHIGSLQPVAQAGYAPFFDQLAQQSLVFPNAFANGKSTIDALPATLAGVPALIEQFIKSPHSGNRLETLTQDLAGKGYDTAFFHGAPNGSMGFAALLQQNGLRHYFGKSEYGRDSDDDGTWGIWDEEFFLYTARTITQLEPPFFATLFSLSSHHPFAVPERYRGQLRQGPDPLQQAIHYTDHALERFFAVASEQPWYQDTLFVITADHASRMGPSGRAEYKTMVGRFAIPLLFFKPGDPTWRGVDRRVAQQLDIRPTVLHYLGFDQPLLSFGNDLLEPASRRFAINYCSGTFQLLQDGYALHFDGSRAVALFDYQADPLLKHNLLAEQPEVVARLEPLIKAIVQQYTTRMWANRLTERTTAEVASWQR